MQEVLVSVTDFPGSTYLEWRNNILHSWWYLASAACKSEIAGFALNLTSRESYYCEYWKKVQNESLKSYPTCRIHKSNNVIFPSAIRMRLLAKKHLDASLGSFLWQRLPQNKQYSQMKSFLIVLTFWNQVSHHFHLAISSYDTGLCKFWMYTLRYTRSGSQSLITMVPKKLSCRSSAVDLSELSRSSDICLMCYLPVSLQKIHCNTSIFHYIISFFTYHVIFMSKIFYIFFFVLFFL